MIFVYFDGQRLGHFNAVTIDNVYVSKAERLAVHNKRLEHYVFTIIYIERGHDVRNLKISELHRREYITPVETIIVGPDASVDNLILENITTENHTDSPEMPVLVNKGNITSFCNQYF